MADIISNSDALRANIMDGLTDAIPDIEQRVYTKIVKLLEDFESAGGKFSTDPSNIQRLLRVQAEIESVLKDAGYFRAANIYIRDLSKITENTVQLHKSLNGLNVSGAGLTDLQKVYAQQAISVLNEGGLSTNFIQPVTNAIQAAIISGNSIADTRELLEKMVIGTPEKVGKLKSYLTVTARDAVTQLQGAQHQAIQQAYDLPYLRYVGSIIKDSRGQCRHWKQMEYISIAELQSEIDMAFKKQDLKVEQPKGALWSGMIDGTNASNFIIRRGGWACRHQAIPVRRKR